jgi:hypothetical protein
MAERKGIASETSRRLWVAAGGRCEYRGCNCYLLEDELTGYELNLAEQAHIIGATEGKGSPRSKSSLGLVERAEALNLMLLCRDHHKVIDQLVAEHGVEGLLKMKREHEERIRLLTDFTEERETVVVRAIGAIRGAPVEIPRSAVTSAVRAEGRYPRYRLALAGEDLEIDLRGLPGEGGQDYWRAGERAIAERMAPIRETQRPLNHLSIFALARMPLLAALGFHLDDKVPVTIYPRLRGGTGDGGWGFDPEAAASGFELRQISDARASQVSIAVSLTAPVGEETLAAAEGARAVYEISPVGGQSRELFSAKRSIEVFAETYHRFLARVEREHPKCEEVHVFLAAPAPAAVQIGRGVMRDAQPPLVIYDRDGGGRFVPALRLER